MPQSFAVVYVHGVFSTKERRAVFGDPDLRAEMHAYVGGVSKILDCQPLIVGGTADHVHILARLGRSIALAEWMKEVKRVSSVWMNERRAFAWQRGYGCFSVSQSNVAEVTEYIADQEARHARIGFQDEYRALLRKHDMVWDERYVCD